MSDPTLWDQPAESHARRTDPETSKIAAAMVNASALEAIVWNALLKHGRMNTRTIGDVTDLPRDSVSPRMRPLERRGAVSDTGEREDGCIVWEAIL